MLRTAVLSLLLALCGYAAADWLTHGFQVWTDEGARRLLARYAAQPVAVDDPGVLLDVDTVEDLARLEEQVRHGFAPSTQPGALSSR